LIPDGLEKDPLLCGFWKSAVAQFVQVAYPLYLKWNCSCATEQNSFQDFLKEGQKDHRHMWHTLASFDFDEDTDHLPGDNGSFFIFDFSYWQNTIKTIFRYWGIQHDRDCTPGTKAGIKRDIGYSNQFVNVNTTIHKRPKLLDCPTQDI
jgi:hypothetical protein